MRTSLAFVALLLALCHTKADHFKAFEDGKRYVYDYRARVATGIDEEVTQFSGFGVRGRVVAQSKGSHVVFQLKNVKVGYINQEIHQNVLEELPITYEAPSGEIAEHLQPLQQPFYVEYDHGVVKSISLNPQEGVEQRNNKRAVASLFQLYLERDVPDLHVYNHAEDSVAGTTLSHYVLDHLDSHYEQQEHEGVLNVTKYRKYEEATRYPHLFYSSIQGYKCVECQQKYFKPLHNIVTVHYNLKGTRDNYVIEDIEANGAITLTPFTTNGQTVLSVVNQTLHLVQVEDGASVELPSGLEQTTLLYEFENDRRDYEHVDLKQPHYYDSVYPNKHPDHVARAEALFQELQQAFKDENAHVSKYVPKFVDLLAEFSYDEYVAFYSKYVLVNQPHSAEHLLLEILPLVGTNPSILYAFNIIKEGKVDVSNANEIIQKVPFYVKEPSQQLIEKAREFGQAKAVVGKPKLYASSRLAYGTLLYKACVEDEFNPHPQNAKHYVSDEACQKYLQGLKDQFNSATDDTQRTIYLRAITNSHLDHHHEFILSVIKGHYDNSLKQTALIGLFDEEPGTKNPNIPAVVAPLFLNPNEDYVLRIHAYEVLLYLYPSPTFFANLVLTLEKDPSEKLKSYIYASLNAYANATTPCIEPYKQYIKHALHFAHHRQTDAVRDSVNRYFTFHNSKYNYGRSTHYVSVPSNESLVPRELYYRQSANLFGYEFDFIELGYSSQGRTFHETQFLANFGLGPRGLGKSTDEAHDDLVKKTIAMLKGVDRTDKPLAPYDVTVRVFNQDIYVTRDLRRSLAERRESSEYRYEDDKIVVDLNTVNYAAVKLVIPNILGMPVVMKTRIPVTGYLHGSFNVGEKIAKVGKEYVPSGIEATTDLHVGLDAIVESEMAVLSAVHGPLGYRLKTKAGLHLPIKGSVDIDVLQHKTQIHYIPSTEPYDVLYYKSIPYTVGKTNVPVYYASSPINRQYSRGHKYLGVGITCNFTYDYYRNDFGAYRDFLKSFFHKTISNQDYYYISNKIWAGVRNFLDYAVLNPTAKPFAFNARFSRSSTNPTTEFVYESEKQINKNYDEGTHRGEKQIVYKNQITGKGTTERRWNLEASVAISWPYRVARKINVHYKRSAIPEYDSTPYEVCYDSSLTVSDYKKIYSLQPVDIKANYEGKLSLGETCGEGAKQVNVHAVLEKSEQQQNFDRTTTRFYKKCQEMNKKGQPFNRYCWQVIQDLARLDKLTVDVDYVNIPEDVKGVFYRVYQFFRHRLYNNLYIDHSHGSGQENHINIVANMSYIHPDILDVKVTRAHETVYYNKIYVPKVLPQWGPYVVTETLYERFARKVLNYHVPQCFITGKYIRTFDEVTYKAPLTTDYHLALTDVHHVFVYYRSVEEGKHSKALKVYVGDNVVELVPHGDKLDVTVNGKPQLTGNSGAYFHKQGDKVDLVVYKYAEGYIVKPKGYGLQIYFDGNNSVISASNFYRENQHGLCGNFDGETRHEFEGPDGKFYHDASDFTHSYAVHA